MKKYFMIIVVVLMVFAFNTSVYAKTDNMGPKCSVNISKTIKIGSTIGGYVSCYEENNLKDNFISVSDFKIKSIFLGRVKISNISKGYKTSENYYRWDFRIKGIFFGKVNIILNSNSIKDENGNSNSPSTTSVVKVK